MPPNPTRQNWLRKNPLLLMAAAAIVGILGADLFAWRPNWILVLVALAAWLPMFYRRKFWLALPGVALTFGFLHTLRLAETFEHPLRVQLLSKPDRPQSITLKARLYPWTTGGELDPKLALAEVTEWHWGEAGAFLPQTARLKVSLPEGFSLTKSGLYEIHGRVSLPKPPMNPGQFDPVSYGLRMGWIALLEAREVELVQQDWLGYRFHLLTAAEASRQWIISKLSLGLEDAGPDGAVILAMTLGTADAAGEEIEDAFRDSGTLHVFAVSGLHVMMLAAIASWSLRWMGTRRSTLFLIFLVLAYAYITGWRPSAARAAFMTSIVLIAPLLHRQSQLTNSLGAAALLLLMFDSHQLFLPGFQLSFGVLLSISIMASWLMDKTESWHELDPFLPPVLATRSQRLGLWARGFVASLVSVSIAAWLGSLPLMMGHFQTITPIAILSNLVLVPAAGICLMLSCASLCLAALQWSGAVIGVNLINASLAKLMVIAATWFGQLPGAHANLDLRFQSHPPAEMRVFQISYGGAANYLRSGDQRWFLDTANERTWRYAIRPFLRHDGINHLDGLILSHADISHVGAVPLILKSQLAPHIHTSLLEPWPLDPPFASLKQLAKQIPPDSPIWKRHGVNDTIMMSRPDDLLVAAHVLYPESHDLYEKANDRGLVLLIQMGAFKILWLNDAGFITEKRLLERHAPVQCDILIRNQHNADFSGLAELILAAKPQAVITSNDSYEVEEKLPQRLREHCGKEHIRLFDLEITGSVGIEIWQDQATLKPFRSGESSVIQPRITND